ncbi:MAG: hypothetical protein RLZZ324_837, partial [Candidatus Parcubacteria bacterium]
MRIDDLVSETVSAVSANKVRSGLTILGIVIGIGAVIAMVAIGQGAQNTIASSIQGLGANLLSVTPGASSGNNRGFVSTGRGGAQTLVADDAAAIAGLNGVAAVSPELQGRNQVVSPGGTNTNTLVVGITAGYATVRNVAVSEGAFITDGNVQSGARVAVIGQTAGTDLFGTDDPLGKTIRIAGNQFKIIGVLAFKGSAGFFNPDDMVLIPLTTMQNVVEHTKRISTLAVSVTDQGLMDAAKASITDLLLTRHKVAEPDFTVVSQADILGTLSQVTGSFTAFLAAVAGISLLVGGIGIMNMMLTTVTERTREIGLRKAIGAKKGEIGAQFLAEAVLLTFLGGAIGVATGWGAATLVTQFAGIATQVSL